MSPINPCLRRVIEWGSHELQDQKVDACILGGDLTHQADPAQADAFIATLNPARQSLVFLPGNNEGPHLAAGLKSRYPTLHPVQGCTRLPWPGHAFALATYDSASHLSALSELAVALPEHGSVLVLAHFPPDNAGTEALAALQLPGVHLYWICGHQHQGLTYELGNLTVTVCGGLDPVKVRGTLPEILAGDWDGQQLTLHHWYAPLERLAAPPQHPPNPLGLAFRGPAESLLETALDLKVNAVQFRWGDGGKIPTPTAGNLADRFRKQFPNGILSLHLPSFTASPKGLNLSEQSEPLAWAEAIGTNDLTLHLPSVPASWLYDAEGQMQDTPWAQNCLTTYQLLAERTINLNANLSLENMYNQRAVSPQDELLSSRPWHLLRFVEMLRKSLLEKGETLAAVARIGVILDCGHAFRDPLVSKDHGLGDWIARLAPILQLIHIHQVTLTNGHLSNHHAILDRYGPRINFAGLLPIIQELVPRQVPLLLEIPEREAVLESRNTLSALLMDSFAIRCI